MPLALISQMAVEFFIDVSNQINNKWNKDTAIAAVSEKSKYSILIRGRIKNGIKTRYISDGIDRKSKRGDNSVVNIIYAYMIFRLVSMIKDDIRVVRICPDHRPIDEVYRHLQKIFAIHGRKFPQMNFRSPPNSPAHNHALKVFRGRAKADCVISKDPGELIKIIDKLKNNKS